MRKEFLALVVFLSGSLALAAGDSVTNTSEPQTDMMTKVSSVLTAESGLPEKKEMAALPAVMAPPATAAAAAAANTAATKGNDEQSPVFGHSGDAKIVPHTSSTGLWGRMMASLAIVLVVIGGAAYAFKRFPGAKALGMRNKMIEVISQHHLGPKKSIAVVRVAGEFVLVGITDSNINILKNLALLDDDIPAAQTPTAGTKTDMSIPKKGKVSDAINEVLGKSSASKTTISNSAASAAQKFQSTLVSKFANDAKASAETEDEFSMQGLREIVGQRLKTMKEI